jgi:thiamine biosynthesis lipoprotein
VILAVEGNDIAVATSGLYERGLHVINPRTGRPAEQLPSVTIVGRDLALTDAYATTVVAMGEPGLTWMAGLKGYEGAAVTGDGTLYTTPGLPRVAEQEPDQPSAS